MRAVEAEGAGEKSRGVPLREHETVVRSGLRVCPVVAEMTVDEHGHEVGRRHAGGGVPRAGDGAGTDRVDAHLLPELPPALNRGHRCNVTGDMPDSRL